jgi:hypothetical protein
MPFCELADFTSNKRKKTVPGICFRCTSEDDRTGTQRGFGATKTAPRKRTALIPEGSTLRRSARAQGQERYHECGESETRSDSDDDGSDGRLFYGLKLRAVDPRYITHGDDRDRGDILITLAQVRELILGKQQSEEGVATVWLTTAENGVLFDRRTERNPMSQGCKGRERHRPIPSTSNITICYKYSGRNWGRSGQRSAGPGCLAGISSFTSTVGQNQQDNGR